MIPELTPAEARVLAAYRGMDAPSKEYAVRHLTSIAKAFPQHSPPKLRLVASNGGPVPSRSR
jgi:hypothetical protein